MVGKKEKQIIGYYAKVRFTRSRDKDVSTLCSQLGVKFSEMGLEKPIKHSRDTIYFPITDKKVIKEIIDPIKSHYNIHSYNFRSTKISPIQKGVLNVNSLERKLTKSEKNVEKLNGKIKTLQDELDFEKEEKRTEYITKEEHDDSIDELIDQRENYKRLYEESEQTIATFSEANQLREEYTGIINDFYNLTVLFERYDIPILSVEGITEENLEILDEKLKSTSKSDSVMNKAYQELIGILRDSYPSYDLKLNEIEGVPIFDEKQLKYISRVVRDYERIRKEKINLVSERIGDKKIINNLEESLKNKESELNLKKESFDSLLEELGFDLDNIPENYKIILNEVKEYDKFLIFLRDQFDTKNELNGDLKKMINSFESSIKSYKADSEELMHIKEKIGTDNIEDLLGDYDTISRHISELQFSILKSASEVENVGSDVYSAEETIFVTSPDLITPEELLAKAFEIHMEKHSSEIEKLRLVEKKITSQNDTFNQLFPSGNKKDLSN